MLSPTFPLLSTFSLLSHTVMMSGTWFNTMQMNRRKKGENEEIETIGKKVSNSNTISMSSPVEGNLLAFPEP